MPKLRDFYLILNYDPDSSKENEAVYARTCCAFIILTLPVARKLMILLLRAKLLLFCFLDVYLFISAYIDT